VTWTDPTVRATGDLITASIYNTDLIANLKALRPGVGSSLPGSPSDGDEYILQNGDGSTWHLRYFGGASRWDFIGGSPLYARSSVSGNTTSTSYSAATGVPSIAIPFAGRYEVEYGHTFSGGANRTVASCPDGLGISASDGNAAFTQDGNGSRTSQISAQIKRIYDLNNNGNLTLKVRKDSNGDPSDFMAWISAKLVHT
jgi:hypothetical protein